MEQYGLPFIPVVGVLGNGSRLFNKAEEMREPFLYTFIESGMWNRQNLIYTAIYTAVQAGLWPTMLFSTPSESDALPQMDLTYPFAIIKLITGQGLAPMLAKGIIDPALITALEMTERKGQESTIYKQTLGQPLGAGASFSETALLHQAGRLPVVMIREKLGWAIADALKMAFLWSRELGSKQKARYNNAITEIERKSIPKTLEIEISVDVTLPQEALQSANIFNILQDKVSQEWLLENVLKVRQPSEMMNKIRTEQAVKVLFGSWLQQRVKQMLQPQQSINAGQSQPPVEPGQEAQLQGLPPVMAQGGMQAPGPAGYEQMPGGEGEGLE